MYGNIDGYLSQNEFAQLTLRKVLSYRGIERTIVQNLVCLMEEDTWNKITDLRANGSLSHFLSYFSVMEPSSPFLYKSIKNDIMNVIKTDIEGMLIIEPRLFRDARGYFFESFSEREFKEKIVPLVGYKVEFC